MGSALQVFEAIPQRDVVSWTSIICGFLRNGLEREAVSAFASMDMRPNARTLVSLLSACSKSDCNSGFELGGLRVGRSIHGFSVRNMMIEGKRVFCNALMDMYAKCGVVEIARLVFYRMAERDVVSWTTMISGYAHCGCLEEAIGLFDEMLKARVEPNEVTFVSVLHACARSGALGLGKWVHQYMTDKNVKMCLFLENSLVDMYAKCGDLDMAMRIFNAMPHRDVISWNAIICGLAMHGNGTHALELFSLMNNVVVRPDAITYIGVLSACSHAGLIDKGCQYFRMMRDVYDISPRMEHYACMVDLYGRAGLLKEAEDFIRNMPAMPNLHVLGALLNACKIHGDMEMCKRVGDLIKEMGLPITGGIYALIANMYTNANRLVDAIEVRETLRDQGVRKSPGCSWIEVHDR
ncbi:pentatricopeptide repeat-containing protein At1g08070, chloroplastic-like [Amborella trichopoda]|uniref:pentatricopeptide repeat-containing protein At1g08070, chloroplastic-like n=1 Tax=Amborella trichopoda TaxID=13333 RepID=UPI0005D380B9|nr:pentatricopeptide repeat-containing protein At1g08070, chloroplastic-like [Amborella trichopoda]|eukprot:XP_011625534.1 pentatricopeptide repeat-containing protein At1g08070, chloroplastic-like [Amborella trichopoda]